MAQIRAKSEKNRLKKVLADRQSEFSEAVARMLQVKTVQIAGVEERMATGLYVGWGRREELVALDREVTARTDELNKLKR